MKKNLYLIQCPPFWIKVPPLGLIYLKNYLEKKEINVKIIDLNILLFKLLSYSKKRWLSLNEKFEKELFSIVEKKFPYLLKNLYHKIKNVDFVGFSLFKRNLYFSLSLAQKIKEKFPKKKIIFGGPHTFFLKRENKLNPEYWWVIGEGEIPLSSILEDEKKKIYLFEEIENLDNLPFLDPKDINFSLYSQYFPLLTSRGCPYKCRFCSEKELFKKFRYHSPLYIAEQIKFLVNRYNFKYFVFCDSLINYNYRWLEEFCTLIIKYNLDIKWEAQARIDKSLTTEIANLMKKSGCYNLFVGLENGSDRTLNLMQKGFDAKTALDFFKKLKEAKLHFEVSLIFGYPQETDKDFQETLDFIVKNKEIIPKIAQANPFVDYLKDFPNDKFPNKEGLERVKKFLSVLEENKIKYTKSFINNLVYFRNGN
jgi:radical SAM superfamily enzyme YgiQ (UPF0313 family)